MDGLLGFGPFPLESENTVEEDQLIIAYQDELCFFEMVVFKQDSVVSIEQSSHNTTHSLVLHLRLGESISL